MCWVRSKPQHRALLRSLRVQLSAEPRIHLVERDRDEVSLCPVKPPETSVPFSSCISGPRNRTLCERPLYWAEGISVRDRSVTS